MFSHVCVCMCVCMYVCIVGRFANWTTKLDPKSALATPVFPFLLNDARQQSLVNKGDFCPLYRIRYVRMYVCMYVCMYL